VDGLFGQPHLPDLVPPAPRERTISTRSVSSAGELAIAIQMINESAREFKSAGGSFRPPAGVCLMHSNSLGLLRFAIE
jgi:hypothetical protein